MAVSERSVGRLRLKVPDRRFVATLADGLEDGLRVASMKSSDARVLLIRRLDLGRVPIRASAHTYGEIWSRRIQQLGAHAVHGAHAQAPTAAAVWFEDALEAHLWLTRSVVTGQPIHAWMARSIIRNWNADVSVGDKLIQIGQSLGALPEAPVAIAHWIDTVGRGGGLIELARACGIEMHDSSPAVQAERSVGEQGLVEKDQRSSVSRRLLVHWLGETGASRFESDPIARTWHDTEPVLACSVPATQIRSKESPVVELDPDLTERVSAETRCGQHIDPNPVKGLQREHLLLGLKPDRSDRPMRLCTCAGGALFLLNVLRALDFEDWRSAQQGASDLGWVAHLLESVLRTLGVPEDDPVRQMIALIAMQSADTSGASKYDLIYQHQQWMNSISQWLRQQTAITLPELVLRPATVTWTRTHVDVWLDPTQADIRIRRAGLDLDPGWIDWFGKVVHFHYESGELS